MRHLDKYVAKLTDEETEDAFAYSLFRLVETGKLDEIVALLPTDQREKLQRSLLVTGGAL